MEKTIIASIITPEIKENDVALSLDELSELVSTAGGDVVDKIILKRQEIENTTYFGSGQLENIKTQDYDVLCGHFEIQGFEMTKGNYNEHGLDQETFKTKIPVWSGHFHIKSKQTNIDGLAKWFQIKKSNSENKNYYVEFIGNLEELNKEDFLTLININSEVDYLMAEIEENSKSLEGYDEFNENIISPSMLR